MTKSHGWSKLDVSMDRLPPNAAAQLLETESQFFGKGECRVILSREPRPNDGSKRWHLSISCANRYPTWEEIKDARFSLLPLALTFAQILPPPSEYVNIYSNCFHLWEIEWNG